MRYQSRFIAVVLLIAMMISFTGCYGDTTWGAEYNGNKMPAGAYILYLFQAYAELNGAKTTSEEAYAEKLQGKTDYQWMIDRAKEICTEHYIIDEKFAELDIELEEADITTIQNNVAAEVESMGAFYNVIGVSDDSVYYVAENSYKRDIVFAHYYGSGGEYEIPEEEILAGMDDHLADVKYMGVPLIRNDGSKYTAEQEALLKERADQIVDRANKGEYINELFASFSLFLEEYDTYLDELDAGNNPDDAFLSMDIPVASVEDPSTGEQFLTSETTYNATLVDDESSLMASFVSLPYLEAATIYEEGYYLFLVVRFEATTREGVVDTYRNSIGEILKGDEFEQMVADWCEGVEISMNEDSIRRYDPTKIFEI